MQVYTTGIQTCVNLYIVCKRICRCVKVCIPGDLSMCMYRWSECEGQPEDATHTATHTAAAHTLLQHTHCCSTHICNTCATHTHLEHSLLRLGNRVHLHLTSVLLCVAVCCSVLQRAAVCCSVLQCVAVCCSVYNIVCCSVVANRVRLNLTSILL